MKLTPSTARNTITKRQPARLALRKALPFVALTLSFVRLLSAAGLDDWEQQAENQFNSLFAGIAYGNGTFVAVGGGGQVATSPHGSVWTEQNLGQTSLYRSVIFAENRFVAVGNNVPVLESPDGITWTPNPDGSLFDFYGIAYGKNVYVAVGFLGKIYTSTDGKSWIQRTSGTSSRLHSVTFGNNQFIACGLSGTILTSPDGTAWTKRNSNTTDGLFNINYGDGVFVSVSSKAKVLYSTDGIDWNSTSLLGGTELWGIAWGNGEFVIVGYAGNNPDGPHLWSSPDGANWTRLYGNVTRTLNAVSFGADRFIAVGDNGTITRSGVTQGPPTPIVQVSHIQMQNGELEFDFETQVGTSYQVQSSANTINWIPEITLVATSSTTTYSEPTTSENRRFLRVRKL